MRKKAKFQCVQEVKTVSPSWEFHQLGQTNTTAVKSKAVGPTTKVQTFEDILDEEDAQLRRQRKKSEQVDEATNSNPKALKKKSKKGVRKESQNEQWGLKMHSDDEIDFEDVMK